MYYVYILQSKIDLATYIGCTSDLRKRIKDHNQGKTRSIKSKRPLRLIYYETFLEKTDARKREIELKTNSYKKETLFKRLGHSFMAPSSIGQDIRFSS